MRCSTMACWCCRDDKVVACTLVLLGRHRRQQPGVYVRQARPGRQDVGGPDAARSSQQTFDAASSHLDHGRDRRWRFLGWIWAEEDVAGAATWT